MSQHTPPRKPLACLRCGGALVYRGKRQFQAAETGSVFSNPLTMAMHACGDCGHVEFFVDTAPGDTAPD